MAMGHKKKSTTSMILAEIRKVADKQARINASTSKTLDHAIEWIEHNPDSWERLVTWARAKAAEGRRFSLGEWVESERWHRPIDSPGRYKMNNDFTPLFSRLLVNSYPEIGPYIETRKSRFDALFQKEEAA